MHVSLCNAWTCEYNALKGQKMSSDSLGQKLQVVVSCLTVGAGNQTWALCQNSKSSRLLSHFSSCQIRPYVDSKISVGMLLINASPLLRYLWCLDEM